MTHLRLRLTAFLVLLTLSLLASPARAGGRLVVCDDVQDPATLDPQKEFSEKNHTLCQQVYDGLVRFNAQGKIEPALATSWEPVNPVTVRFHLRKGVTFHNGEPFNAAAVKFTLERYLDPKTGFPAVAFINSIKAAAVVDDHTIDIETVYPDGLLLNRLAGFVLIVPPGYVREKGDSALHEQPVGTGAFKFDRWEKGKQIVLSANQSYWLPGSPKVEELVFRFVTAEEQAKLLLSGEVDLVTELPGTLTLEVTRNTGTKIAKQQAFWTVGATMNTSKGALADVRVRRALNLAIDREALIRFDSKGNGAELASLTMKGEDGHNPDLKPYGYDPEKAKALLVEAGVRTPLVLKTLIRVQGERTAKLLAAQLKKIGVELDIQAKFSDADVITGLQSEPWDMAIAGLPDPMCHSFFMQSILLFSQSPYSLHKDPAFDGRLIEMVMTPEPKRREALAQEIDAYVHDQALSLFTYQKIKTYGVSRRATFVPYISGMPYFFSAEVNDEPAASTAQASEK